MNETRGRGDEPTERPSLLRRLLGLGAQPTRQPTDRSRKARDELLERFRIAYKALNEAHGLVEQLESDDFKLLGFDTRQSLIQAIEQQRNAAESGIDALNGDNIAKAKMVADQVFPFVRRILSVFTGLN